MMKGITRTIAVMAFVALLVPLTAVAKESELKGPSALAGKGFFGGDITMEMADGQRPVQIGARGGYVGILDLGGDLEVRCQGKGVVQKKQTDRGDVYLCAGRGGQAIVLGSHFKFRGFAMRYRALVPAGASGTFHGRFVECTKADGESEAKWSCGDERRNGIRERADEKRDELKERGQAKQDERKDKAQERKDKAQEQRQERKQNAQEKRQERKEKGKQRGAEKPEASENDEVPTLAELAAMLAGK